MARLLKDTAALVCCDFILELGLSTLPLRHFQALFLPIKICPLLRQPMAVRKISMTSAALLIVRGFVRPQMSSSVYSEIS